MSRTLKRYAIIVVLLMVAIFAVACTPDDNDGGINANSVDFGTQTSFLVLGSKDHATADLSAKVTPADSKQQTFEYTSSNTSVATINQAGVVTAVAPGKTTITAKLQDTDLTSVQEVTVYSAATKVNIGEVANTKLRIGHSTLGRVTLDASVEPATAAQKVTYRSSNPNVLEVNSTTGVVTAKSQSGSFVNQASIFAVIAGDYTANGESIETEVKFDIFTQATAVRVSFAEGSIDEVYNGGPTTQLQAVVEASTAEQVVDWTSDSSYLVVNNNGLARAQDIGDNAPVTARITATESVIKTQKDSKDIIVYQAPASIELQSIVLQDEATTKDEEEGTAEITTRRIAKGSELALNANIEPWNAKQTLVWTATNQDVDGNGTVDAREVVGTVDENGIFTAVGTGEVVVTVTDFFGVVSDEIKFVVEESKFDYQFQIQKEGQQVDQLVVGDMAEIWRKVNTATDRVYLESSNDTLAQIVEEENGDYALYVAGAGDVSINYGVANFDGISTTDPKLSLWHTQIATTTTITRTTDFINKYSDLTGISVTSVDGMDGASLVTLTGRIIEAGLYASTIELVEPEALNNPEYVAILASIETLSGTIDSVVENNIPALATFLSQVEPESTLAIENLTVIVNELFVLASGSSQISQEKLDELVALHTDMVAALANVQQLIDEFKATLNPDNDKYYVFELFVVSILDMSNTQLTEAASKVGDALVNLQDQLDQVNAGQGQEAA